jgi:hypothetical protein
MTQKIDSSRICRNVIELPDHAIHFFPSLAFPFPGQAPADHTNHFLDSARMVTNEWFGYLRHLYGVINA